MRTRAPHAARPGDRLLPLEAGNEAGAEAFRRATVPHLRAVRELFIDALTPDQIVAAGELAEAVRTHLDAHRNG